MTVHAQYKTPVATDVGDWENWPFKISRQHPSRRNPRKSNHVVCNRFKCVNQTWAGSKLLICRHFAGAAIVAIVRPALVLLERVGTRPLFTYGRSTNKKKNKNKKEKRKKPTNKKKTTNKKNIWEINCCLERPHNKKIIILKLLHTSPLHAYP